MKNRYLLFIALLSLICHHAFCQTQTSAITATLVNLGGGSIEVRFTPNQVLSGAALPLNVYLRVPESQAGGTSFTTTNNPFGLTAIFDYTDNGWHYFYYQTLAQIPITSWSVGTPVTILRVTVNGPATQIELSGGDQGPAISNGAGGFFWPGTALTVDNTSTNLVSWPINSSIALPIELLFFTARPLNATDAKLDWETASELNSSHFEVERSTDGKNWQQVGKVAAAGFSQQNHSYSLIDEKVFEPGESSLSVFYYRLKMLDLDGSFTYSKVREVHFERAGGLVVGELFPNPAERGHVAFQLPLYTEQEASLRLTVFDVRGSVVGLFETDLAAGEQLAGFDLGQLAAGVYHIRVLVNGETFARRLVVQ